MDEEQLALVEAGLAKMIKKFKQNLRDGDLQRMKKTQHAKTAIRKIILAVAIKGNVKAISPFIENENKVGFEVIDHHDRVLRYYP
jgi:hypothetical protein